MHRKLIPILIFFITASFLLPFDFGLADEKINLKEFQEEWTLERYTKYFYNRYSTHFDEFGISYSAPDYDIYDFKSPESAREYISLALYYSFRAQEGDYKACDIIRSAVFKAKSELSKRPLKTQSFEDAEAVFLISRTLKKLPELFSKNDKNILMAWIAKCAEAGIKAPDTENRAIISGAHWQYVIDYLNAEGEISALDKRRYGKMIKDKIDFAIKTNITKDNWYIEGRFNNFTPHYHAVSAYMLMIYSKLTGYEKYAYLSYEMYKNIKKISFDNGMVEARLGHRPSGLGAQFYFMAGCLGKAFNDNDYTAYLFYGFGDRFFSDPRHPNRLEYHSTIEEMKSEFNDDYSFADAAELALSMPSLNEQSFKFTCSVSAPEISAGERFIQKNDGREIIFAEKRFILGSYGNFSREVKN
ncbi:MAG: hypothetical protein V1860_04080 [bacterium]